MPPAVSVVIPTFNSQAFVGETLESIFQQTVPPQEILIVDDASTDATCAAVQALADGTPIPIRLVRLENNTGNPAVPLNVGVEQAAGPLVALMDHDDMMLPRKLEVQASSFIDNPELVMVFSDFRAFDADSEGDGLPAEAVRMLGEAGRPRRGLSVIHGEVMTRLQLLYSGIIQSCSSLMFRKSVWESGARFDPKRGVVADYVFKLQVTRQGPVGFVPEPLFKKRVHAANLYNRDPSDQTAQHVYDVIIKSLRENPDLLADEVFRDQMMRMLLSRAWAGRRAGRYGESLHLYRECLRTFGLSRSVVGQLLRFPFAVIHGLWFSR